MSSLSRDLENVLFFFVAASVLVPYRVSATQILAEGGRNKSLQNATKQSTGAPKQKTGAPKQETQQLFTANVQLICGSTENRSAKTENRSTKTGNTTAIYSYLQQIYN